MKVLVTGGSGLVGSHACEFYAKQGHDIIAVDNYMRGELFGKTGSTEANAVFLAKNYPNISFFNIDIRNETEMKPLVKGSDIVIHTAAQPSHPKSIEIPAEDFSINAWGTLLLLETVRKVADGAVFVHCSTNKVYGENPNEVPIIEKATRYDYADRDGIAESMPVDNTIHTPFGVSKLAGDLYAQEYGKLYGLKTGVFRMGCITGSRAMAVEMHNWEPYFLYVNITEQVLNVYGYEGKQVRDVIDARDLVRAFDKFSQNPRPGEAYNMGGGRKNSISLLESFKLIESITGKPMKYVLKPKREGDHKVYISDLSKFKSHYEWGIEIGLEKVFRDIYDWMMKNKTLQS
ncbi:NAD-dependent epimerase/dehydratase family protein [Candidatus Bathyarchaeota archaeon]|nr:NAD-dependent epimerase/dehydratase family protein [Candidatus Bathyarchaeota archaeon]